MIVTPSCFTPDLIVDFGAAPQLLRFHDATTMKFVLTIDTATATWPNGDEHLESWLAERTPEARLKLIREVAERALGHCQIRLLEIRSERG